MIRINILTTKHASSSLALTPLFVNKRRLREYGITFQMFYDDVAKLYDADVIIVDGRVYRKWQAIYGEGDRENGVTALLERLNRRVEKVLWFDTTDGTGTTQFQFLPYVDKYLKIQILRDKAAYQQSYYGGRTFSEYYHNVFGVQDSHVFTLPIPAKAADLHKIQIGWGYPLADYGRWAPLLRRVRRHLPVPTFYSQMFIEPTNRAINASFRFSTNYHRETVAFQRRLVGDTARKLGFPTDRISRAQYLKELRNCKVAVSPFGWGEPSYKDFEIIINGGALVKPDMSHLETWPDLYLADETYIPFKWDCSDLEAVLDDALAGDKWHRVACRAQAVYRKYLFDPEGGIEFCERIQDLAT